jgi:thioredoxin reductase (NADPH)
MLDLLIIGSGPAGLNASIYASRACLTAKVVEREYMGTGQIAESSRVDNYMGLPELDGYSLGEKFREHAEKLGAEFVDKEVSDLTFDENVWTAHYDDGTTESAKAVIYAAGRSKRVLGAKGEDKFTGKGISYCAVCDGAFFKDKNVAVVGGGDTAVDDALYLADICKNVYLIHRRDEFRCASASLENLRARENVTIITKANISEISGEDKVSEVTLDNGTTLTVDGIFIAIGMVPQTEMLKKFGVCDEAGYVKAGEDCITAKPGLFVAGDIREKKLRQVITAAADGANAVNSAIEYIKSLNK